MSQRAEMGSEITVLVVDDAAVDRRMTGGIIEHALGWGVEYAQDGASALAAMERATPRLVLTDLRMPGMNGLELVKAVRARYPTVPVVLVTAFGNEDIAIQAFRDGAASYVPEKDLDHTLASTLAQVVAAAQTERRQQRLLERLARTESHFALENDRVLIPALVALVQEHLVRLGLCDQTERIRVGVALEETLLNAIYHGNLEVSSALRQEGDDPYYRITNERRRQPLYRDRQVHFTYQISRSQAVFTIRDEGPGFDPSTLPDPTDPANLGKVGGRGLLLIRTFMDEVTFGASGNQITLVNAPCRRASGDVVKILIADDDLISRTMLQGVLTDWGHEVAVARDGAEAWRLLQESAPELAVLDWVMPGLDGAEICRRVRRSQSPTPVYLILLTARNAKADVVAGLQAGANDYVTKPFDPDELRARVQVGRMVTQLQASLAARVRDLEGALALVKQLQGLLPMCCYCKKVRDDRNYWQQVEQYLSAHSEVQFSHGICPDCWRDKVEPQLGHRSRESP